MRPVVVVVVVILAAFGALTLGKLIGDSVTGSAPPPAAINIPNALAGLFPSSTPTATTTPEPTVTATPTSTSTPTPLPTSTPTPGPFETRVFSAGPINVHQETIVGQAGQTLEGYFTVQGGSTPDIIFTLYAPNGTILDQRNRAVARYDFPPYQLPASGTYVMTFDNSYSIFATKRLTMVLRVV